MDENRRRDDVIARELSRAFRAQGAAAGGPHLDAEVAAAWMERRLDTAASQSVEAHLASCTDCQAIVATLARIAPEAADAGNTGWWSRLRLPWLVPVAAATAAALVIWVVQPQRQSSPQFEGAFARAEAPVETVPPAAPETRRLAQAEPTPESPAATEAKREAGASIPAPGTNAAAAPAAPLAQTRDDAEAAPSSARDQLKVATGVAPPTQPSPAATGNLQARAAGSAAPPPPDVTVTGTSPLVDVQTSSRTTVGGTTPAAPPAAERQEAAASAPPPAGFNEAARLNRARSLAGGLVVAATAGTARWRRAGSGFEFAASANGPFSAAALPVDASALVAGSSPAGTVCWLVGTAGVVLVSTDGTRFERVSPPAAVDLASVTATDARSAVVTTADGRRFRTTDQGANWTALPSDR